MQTGTNSTIHGQVVDAKYFPHIDGLRAFAILPVLIYHIMPNLCPGGFAGVDVFFVISGYLITGGILRDLQKDRFTIQNFYHRRIRRILPAYFAVIVCIFIVGCILLYSTMLVYLADSSVMGTLFSANIYAWREGGNYFAAETHSNPLLHLWSLSVEEQFYLFIPILCVIIWKVRSKFIIHIFATIALISFTGSLLAMHFDKQTSAFYLLQYRAWELLVGSLLSMAPVLQKGDDGVTIWKSIKIQYSLVAILGMMMVLIPYTALSPASHFPGLLALSPVLGAAILVRYGQAGLMCHVLSWKPFVSVGKISYSLYLWHWPVAVFWRYVTYDYLYFYDYLGMYGVSLALAYISWRFIEMPVRKSSLWTMKRTFAFAASGIVILVSVGLSCIFYRGWPRTFHAEANSHVYVPPKIVERLVTNKIRQFKVLTRLRNDFTKTVMFSNGGEGDSRVGLASSPPDFYLIGDSHAGALQLGFDILSKEAGKSGIVSTVFGTKLYDFNNPETKHFFKELSIHPEISKIILATYWRHNDQPEDFMCLRDFAQRMQSLNKSLYIILDVPYYKTSPCELNARLKIIAPRADGKSKFEETTQSGSKYNQLQNSINTKIIEISGAIGATVIPLNLAFKKGDDYIIEGEIDGQSYPLYADNNHLSPYGSLLAARFILRYIYPSISVTGNPSELKEVIQVQ